MAFSDKFRDSKKTRDGRTDHERADRPTDPRTDRPLYRNAWTRLKSPFGPNSPQLTLKFDLLATGVDYDRIGTLGLEPGRWGLQIGPMGHNPPWLTVYCEKRNITIQEGPRTSETIRFSYICPASKGIYSGL